LRIFLAIQNTHMVNKKFKQCVTFLHKNCIINKPDAANILRNIYDKDSNIKYEFIAYTLDRIVYDALHEE